MPIKTESEDPQASNANAGASITAHGGLNQEVTRNDPQQYGDQTVKE